MMAQRVFMCVHKWILFMCVHKWIFFTRMNDGSPLVRAADRCYCPLPLPIWPKISPRFLRTFWSTGHVRAPLDLPSFREVLSALGSSEGLSRLSWTRRGGNARERLSTGRVTLSLVYRPSRD